MVANLFTTLSVMLGRVNKLTVPPTSSHGPFQSDVAKICPSAGVPKATSLRHKFMKFFLFWYWASQPSEKYSILVGFITVFVTIRWLMVVSVHHEDNAGLWRSWSMIPTSTWSSKIFQIPCWRRRSDYELPAYIPSVVNPSTATGRTYTLSHLEMAAVSAALVEERLK